MEISALPICWRKSLYHPPLPPLPQQAAQPTIGHASTSCGIPSDAWDVCGYDEVALNKNTSGNPKWTEEEIPDFETIMASTTPLRCTTDPLLESGKPSFLRAWWCKIPSISFSGTIHLGNQKTCHITKWWRWKTLHVQLLIGETTCVREARPDWKLGLKCRKISIYFPHWDSNAVMHMCHIHYYFFTYKLKYISI